ncbi:hypothetical protein [Delftia sp. GW456-R20]|uniref:hypothetical protein n=1 Tax=Delftia sp. GW456-R20 TaxID=1827145 RepID=UPI0012E87178|nr:hypothetical protein [Delftia sp. GW456-R20]
MANKEVQMSIKVEADLKAQFTAAAADSHRPYGQVIRDLMRLYIASRGTPLTVDSVRLREDIAQPSQQTRESISA